MKRLPLRCRFGFHDTHRLPAERAHPAPDGVYCPRCQRYRLYWRPLRRLPRWWRAPSE